VSLFAAAIFNFSMWFTHLLVHLTLTRTTLSKLVISIATQLPVEEFGNPFFHGTTCPTLEFAVSEHQEYPAEQDLSTRPEVNTSFGGVASTRQAFKK
jgi:hypothetical protein